MASQESKQLEPWCNLNGKVVLVTGASAGLGREFCPDLARAQCRIVAAARRTDRLKTLCDQINQPSFLSSRGPSTMAHDHDEVGAVAIELDVTSNAQTIEVAVQKAWEAFGHIDALINNAGVREKVYGLQAVHGKSLVRSAEVGIGWLFVVVVGLGGLFSSCSRV